MAIPSDILAAVKDLIRYEPMNLVLNPGFEDDFTNWTENGDGSGGGNSQTIDTSVVKEGSKSFKLVANANGVHGRTQDITVLTDEREMVIEGWMNVTAYTQGSCNISAYDTVGAAVLGETTLQTATTSGWEFFTTTFTKTAGVTNVQVRATARTSTPILTAYYDRVTLGYSDTVTFIQDIYERELEALCQKYDWWAEQETLTSVEDQSIYSMQASGVRPIGIILNNFALAKTTAWALDQRSGNWQADASGSPQYWLFDQIPAALDGLGSVASNQFAVHPPPNAASAGANNLHIFETAVPASFEPTLTWADELLALRVASETIRQNVVDRRLEIEGDNLVLAQFYREVANLWEGTLANLIPR